MDHGRAAARALDGERLSRERVVLRIRALAPGFDVVQPTVPAGDSVALTWLLVVPLLAVQGVAAALLRRPDRGACAPPGGSAWPATPSSCVAPWPTTSTTRPNRSSSSDTAMCAAKRGRAA